MQGSGFGVCETGFKIQSSGFRLQSSGFRVYDSGFRMEGSGFRVQVFRMEILGCTTKASQIFTFKIYPGTSFIKKRPPVGPYSRSMSKAL